MGDRIVYASEELIKLYEEAIREICVSHKLPSGRVCKTAKGRRLNSKEVKRSLKGLLKTIKHR